jgi:deoxyuridine 5'-triphosphate nucleotidohydrolase
VTKRARRQPPPLLARALADLDDESRAYLAGFAAAGGRVAKHTRAALAATDASWPFARGALDAAGHVNRPGRGRDSPRCTLRGPEPLCERIAALAAIPIARRGRLDWHGTNALDFLARLYDGAAVALPSPRDRYLAWTSVLAAPPSGLAFRWARIDPAAVPPRKEHASDCGFDLTLVRVASLRGQVTFFGTGVQIEPPFGWYFDLVARSSISKSGYLLANGIGVIDRAYRGELLVPLVKIDPAAPDLVLPARVVQLVPRPIVHMRVEEAPSLDDTPRGSGGFGSTG